MAKKEQLALTSLDALNKTDDPIKTMAFIKLLPELKLIKKGDAWRKLIYEALNSEESIDQKIKQLPEYKL